MLHSLVRICTCAALCGLLLAPFALHAQDRRVRHVQDDAGLFSQEARDKADAIVTQIADRHHKELFIETVKEGPADVKEHAAWAKTRFNNYKMDGVYIVFSKNPKFYRIEVGNKTREKGYFGAEDVHKLGEIIKAAKTKDDMLTRVADYTLDTMNRHAPVKENAPNKGRQPVNAPANPDQGGMPSWVGWLCMIGAVLLVIWVIFAIIRAATGMGGGYGYGGYGGGGFLTGMLGGMFGAMAGMWMYNTFFGGHANYQTGDWGDSGAAGAAGYDGDTDVGASGGGEWGADDDKAGGDWGGDAGGGDAGGGCGGGDAGGGCGGGGCGGGGCGGGD